MQDARRLARVMTSFDNARRRLDQQATLGTADMRLLWLLNDGASLTLREIAERLGLEQSTVNRQVNAAVKHELLVRSRNKPNEPYRFRCSTVGFREFEQTLEATLGVYGRALDALGSEAGPLLALLERYVQAYHQAVEQS